MRTLIKHALARKEGSDSLEVAGWVRTRRDSKAFSFIELNDGSCLDSLQVVAGNALSNYDSEVVHLTAGCSVIVTGTLAPSHVPSPGHSTAT